MPGKHVRRFRGQCLPPSEETEEEEDDAHGYHRLGHTEDVAVTMSGETIGSPLVSSSQGPRSGQRSAEKYVVYAEMDAKGKRLSKKLRRKKVRKRIGHVLHSTWKWVKRGAVAAAPSLAAMFILSPVPVFSSHGHPSRR
jgi:hypothetical protein